MNSPSMELEALYHAMTYVRSHIQTKKLVTDASISVIRIMVKCMWIVLCVIVLLPIVLQLTVSLTFMIHWIYGTKAKSYTKHLLRLECQSSFLAPNQLLLFQLGQQKGKQKIVVWTASIVKHFGHVTPALLILISSRQCNNSVYALYSYNVLLLLVHYRRSGEECSNTSTMSTSG